MKNIVLIGMAGSGKSTLGVLLAKTLGMPFIDTDLIIQEREKDLLQNIIDSKGIEQFLQIEETAILSSRLEGTVIATGGSVVYSELAMSFLRKNGIMVYLKVDFEEIEKRIMNITTRGIVMGKGKSLKDTYYERVALYEKYADIIVEGGSKNIEENLEEVLLQIRG